MDISIIDNTEDESDELFSDDEQKKEIKRDGLILNRLETPSSSKMTSSDDIPHAPLSLLPLLSKINEQWTSDFETPQAQPYIKLLTSATKKTEETPKLEQHTPDISTVKSIDKIISDSPVIAEESRASRRRSKRSKRRIFETSISIDPVIVKNNENVTINVSLDAPSTSENINSTVQNSVTNVAEPISNILEDCQLKVFSEIENSCNNEDLDNHANTASDSLDTSTQEFFKNASFSNIDQVCFNTFDNQTAQSMMHCNERIEDIDKERNIEENKTIGFFTARGASINVSKQAVLKAKRLFADAFDIDENHAQNYESFAKRNSNEQKNKYLSSFSFNTTSIDITKEILSKSELQFTEQLKNCDKMHITDCEKTFINKSSNKEVNMVPILFSTASGAPINISKEALTKANILLADELEKNNDKLIKCSKTSSTDRDSTKNVTLSLFSTASGNTISISEKSLAKAKMLLEDESEKENDIIKNYEKSFTGGNSTKSNNVTSSLFSTAGGKPINISKTSLTKAKILLADTSEKENDILIKYSDKSFIDGDSTKPNNMTLFSTAAGKAINISEKSLAKAKILLADELEKENNVIKNSEKSLTDENSIKPNNITSSLFSTADGKPINISEKSLAKAKILLTESEKENDIIKNFERSFTDGNSIKPNNMTSSLFSTAGGKPINISKTSLTKAKILLADTSEKENDTLIKYSEKSFTDGNPVKNYMTLPLFSTTDNKSINISEKSPAKAKILLAGESRNENDILEKYSKRSTTDENFMKPNNMTLPLFSTAGGKSINISEKSLAKAKILFAEQLDTTVEQIKQYNIHNSSISSHIAPNEKIKRCDLKIPCGEFYLESDQEITVSNNALFKSQTFFSNNHPDNNSSDLKFTSLQKRNSDSDENTPLSRNSSFDSKKARLSNEYQARKLFSDNLSIDNDENRNLDEKKQANSTINSVLRSPERDAVESEMDAGSPVLGTHSRKRKDLGHRRDKYSALRASKITLDDVKNVASRENVTFCNNINVNESDIEVQKSTQMEKQKAESNTEWNEYGDTQLMMHFVDESARILQDRLTAALDQEKIITAKRRHGSKQSIGHLYRYKQVNSNARLSLREIGNGAPPVPFSYQELINRQISPNILAITAATATSYTFRCSDFYGAEVARTNVRGIPMEDDARLILDENGYVGIWEFLRAFLASPGVDPNLVPARWVENHYRWIVWKLASMDRMKFGSAELPRALTPSRVMAQLKYRYDREIDQFQRSAIRRILEKDDVASKRMILCVSSIVENNNVSTEVGKSPRIGVPKWRIELTDGWYSIPICIDIGLVKSISTGKIKEGTKLVVSGAELLNCDQGFYPLEAPATVCLKLHTNSTRRARWYAKLGYAPRSGPIPIKLCNVCPSGGLIGKMTIIVARVYPTLYHEKTASGDSIVRNAKCEEKAQSTYEQQCLSKIETFYANAEKDFQEGLTDETELDEDYGSSSQESASKKRRSEELLQELHQKKERFMQDIQSKLRDNLPGPRQVSQLLKVRVCDENVNAILSVWSPSEEVVSALKEGAHVSLYNVIASGKRGTELQLTGRRSSIFKPVKVHDTSYPARVHTSFSELANFEFAPPYGEFDTVGFVCCVGPAPYGMKDFEVVHLAYPKTDSNDSLYLSILFWQGIASYGYTDILTVGSIVACSNLEWRRATSWNVPAAYCTDKTIFTCNPRRNHLYESFENLQNLITDPIKYTERCTLALNVELQKKSTPTHYVAGKSTPIKMYNSIISSVDKRLIDYTSPLAAPKLGVGSSPSFIAANPSIQRRLEKLQYYGEPPELSPLILRKSKRVSLNFQSPVRTTKDTSSTKQSGDPSSSDTSEKQ
ncbi:breast cancer type 2 susceptibility protein homolog isoform X1 [Camponotus floridanus]|uniref:breast cancer type 2 susceptibility protein homolog isoform X1 n=1 Tax=Camponotus floridanus TaxID=104421 RepID=UPI000DC690DB|nr:breast cancer type 2 susceptibility protein homolog isoform X1 [Camponotus floridanus]